MTKAEYLNYELSQLQASIENNPTGLGASEIHARYNTILKVIRYINQHPEQTTRISTADIDDFKNSETFDEMMGGEFGEDDANDSINSLSLSEIITFQSISLLSLVNLKLWEDKFDLISSNDIGGATKFTHDVITPLVKRRISSELLTTSQKTRITAYEQTWIQRINNRNDLSQEQKDVITQHFRESIAAIQEDESITMIKNILTTNPNLRRKMLFQVVANNRRADFYDESASKLDGEIAPNIGIYGEESLFFLPKNTTLNHMWQILKGNLVISMDYFVSQSYILQETAAANPEFKKLMEKDIGLLAYHVMEKCDLTKNMHVIFDSSIKDHKLKQTNRIIGRNIQKIWIEKKIETASSSDYRKATSFIADFDEKYNRLNELTTKRTAEGNIAPSESKELNRLTRYLESSVNTTKYLAAQKYLIDFVILQIQTAAELLINAPIISKLHKDDFFFKEARIKSHLREVYDNKMQKLPSFSSYCKAAEVTNLQGTFKQKIEQIRTATTHEVQPMRETYSSFNTIAEQNINEKETVRASEAQHQQQQEERRIREIQENPELLIQQNIGSDCGVFRNERINIAYQMFGGKINSIQMAMNRIDDDIRRTRQLAARPQPAHADPVVNDDESTNPPEAAQPQPNDAPVVNNEPTNPPQPHTEIDILVERILANKENIWMLARSRLYEKQMQRVEQESQKYGIDPGQLTELYCSDLNKDTRASCIECSMNFYVG